MTHTTTIHSPDWARYAARCSCGWAGNTHTLRSTALREASQHETAARRTGVRA